MGWWQDYTDYVRGVTDAVGDWLTMWLDDDDKRKVKNVIRQAPNYMETGDPGLRLVRFEGGLFDGSRYVDHTQHVRTLVSFTADQKRALSFGIPVMIGLVLLDWWERRPQ